MIKNGSGERLTIVQRQGGVPAVPQKLLLYAIDVILYDDMWAFHFQDLLMLVCFLLQSKSKLLPAGPSMDTVSNRTNLAEIYTVNNTLVLFQSLY